MGRGNLACVLAKPDCAETGLLASALLNFPIFKNLIEKSKNLKGNTKLIAESKSQTWTNQTFKKSLVIFYFKYILFLISVYMHTCFLQVMQTPIVLISNIIGKSVRSCHHSNALLNCASGFRLSSCTKCWVCQYLTMGDKTGPGQIPMSHVTKLWTCRLIYLSSWVRPHVHLSFIIKVDVWGYQTSSGQTLN